MSLNKETLYSNNHATVNSKQIDLLKKHFPQCFDKSGNFIQEKMLEIVNENDIDLSKESYSLNWLGKSYARLLTSLPPETLLTEDKNHNQLDENKDSKNLLIKGDNLEVLKHLVNAYSEKVKMIYIDPPYNTGSDGFIYNDDRKFTKEQLSELAGIDIDEAERILEFTTSKSNSHSAWLTFMYPRLYVARELLKDDGVIFISIDDNEQAQLKIICDEIFGIQNLLCQFTWRTDGNFDNQAKIKVNHEYIVCYVKQANMLKFPETIDPNIEESSKLFKNKIINTIVKNGDKNPVSTITLPAGFKANFAKGFVKARNNIFPYFHNDAVIENYILVNDVTVESGWSSKRNLELFIGNNMKPTVDTKGQLTDYRLTENGAIESVKIRGIQSHVVSSLMNMGSTQSMGAQLNKEFNISFSFPKPVSLIRYLISITSDKSAYILDFFSGSGTTAHAVLEQNIYDNGTRKFISIQLAEKMTLSNEALKLGYKTIFDITNIRITKAAQKIKSKNLDYKGDLGFKIFETVEDFRRDNTALTLESLNFFDSSLLTYEQYQSLLITWSLYDSNLLTDNIINIQLNNYQGYYCNGCLYLLAPGFSNKALKALLLKLDNDVTFVPHKVVIYGDNFDSVKQRELNEALKNYSNKKSLDLNIVVRN